MFGFAAALAVTSVVLYFLEGRHGAAKNESGAGSRQSQEGILLAPMVGQASGGLLTTRF
jgi:hypothetical protein